MIEPLAWIDGVLRPALDEGRAGELLAGASLAYGLSAFEGILCAEDPRHGGSHVLRLDDHLGRLQRSTRALGWELPYTLPQLEEAVLELLRRLGPGCYYVRPLVFSRRDFTDHDVACGPSAVSVAIHCVRFALPAYLLQMNRGRRATVSASMRLGWPPQLSGAKLSGKYLALLAALAEARSRRYDEAILLDDDGQVAEASTANLFAVRQGALVTPPATWALPGVTRRCVLELAPSLGLRCEERPLSVDELLGADEVFLTNTARGLVAIEEIDGRWRTRGHEHTHRLRQAYINVLTGDDTSRAAWLTRVAPGAPPAAGGAGG